MREDNDQDDRLEGKADGEGRGRKRRGRIPEMGKDRGAVD